MSKTSTIFLQMENLSALAGLIGLIVAMLFIVVLFFPLIKGYKRCLSYKIPAVYGITGKVQSVKCTHGSSAFIWPVFQEYAFLDLNPIADKLPELVKTRTKAIKNLKIDKITVWEGIENKADGKTSTANFLSGIYKSLPPLEDMFNIVVGMQLPSYLNGDNEKQNEKTTQSIKTQKAKRQNNLNY